MASAVKSNDDWGSHFRLVAADKWKAKSAAMGQAVTDALVEYARPRTGMQVLDLASGTGEPAISLAMRVGEQGHVTALDRSADLLEIARGRAEARGLRNFSIRQADAQSLPFPDEAFDMATSRFGVMFFKDGVAAMRELRRVLKPGARACFVVWGSFKQPYFQSMIGVVLRHAGGPLLPPGGDDPFRFAEAGSLSAVLRAAGFQAVEEQLVTLPWDWPGSVEEVWEYSQQVAAPFRAALDRVPADMRPRIDAAVHEAVGKYFDGQKVAFGAKVVLASGTK